MRQTAKALAVALVAVALGAGAAVGQDAYVGTVMRVDHPASVVVLQDGRMVQVAPTSTVLVNNQPMPVTTLQPGSYVVIRGAQPVAYHDGRYVLVSATPVTTPVEVPATTTTVTTVTTTPPVVSSASGTISSVDHERNVVYLTDGRIVQLTGKSAIWVNGHPTHAAALRPGMSVMISSVNPVVYRNGRYVVYNPGFFDPGNGSSMTWDAKFAGYEAEMSNAAMQPQGGG